MLSDGNALATSVAAFMEEHYKNIGSSTPSTVTFLSKGATPLSITVDLVSSFPRCTWECITLSIF